MKRWIRFAGMTLVALLAVTIAGGAAWEFRQRSLADEKFPLRGKRVDIGGRSLYLDCQGEGSPTVVLEAGLDPRGSLAWASVHDSLASTTRTCAYSRAGILGSDDRPDVPTGERIASDLDALLKAANEQSPFVMVGHSLGGPLIVQYTQLFPERVAGLVMVDASHPDQVAMFTRAAGRKVEMPTSMRLTLETATMLSWAGVARALFAPKLTALDAHVPRDMQGAMQELRLVEQIVTLPHSARSLGDRPMIVLTAGKENEIESMQQMAGLTREQVLAQSAGWDSLQADITRWSSRGRRLVLPKSGHYVHNDRPDVFLKAVREVVDSVRMLRAIAQSTSKEGMRP